jgi:predicted esterase
MAAASACVVWAHGLGDTGAGWSWLPRAFRGLPHVKWQFPTAPERPVSVNGGYVMVCG